MSKRTIGLIIALCGVASFYAAFAIYGDTDSLMFIPLCFGGLWGMGCGTSVFLVNCEPIMKSFERLAKWFLDL